MEEHKKTSKRCTYCLRLIPLVNFGYSSFTLDGTNSRCLECSRIIKANSRRKLRGVELLPEIDNHMTEEEEKEAREEIMMRRRRIGNCKPPLSPTLEENSTVKNCQRCDNYDNLQTQLEEAVHSSKHLETIMNFFLKVKEFEDSREQNSLTSLEELFPQVKKITEDVEIVKPLYDELLARIKKQLKL